MRLTIETEQKMLKVIEHLLKTVTTIHNQGLYMVMNHSIKNEDWDILRFDTTMSTCKSIIDIQNPKEFFEEKRIFKEMVEFFQLWKEKPEVIERLTTTVLDDLKNDLKAMVILLLD